MKVGIAGVGGIGSNVAMHLVRSGFKSFTFIDFDRVETSNLNRQFYFENQIGELKVEALKTNLLRINRGLNISTTVLRLNLSNINSVLSDCDLLVEGFDKAADKKLFIEFFGPSGKIIVSANGIAGFDTESIQHRKIANIHIFGDFNTDCNDAPLYSHKVMVVAAMMAGRLIEHSKNPANGI